MHYLLQANDFKIHQSELPKWLVNQYAYWNEVVGNKDFPCHFGVQAEKQGALRYTYIENNNIENLPDTLKEFLILSKSSTRKRHALVVFLEPVENKDLDFYNSHFWSILNYLHDNDDMEWPKDWPKDPNNQEWEFIFNEEPMFVSANMPAYKNRTTRNIGKSQILIFQPRRIFKDISPNTKFGSKAIELIREKVEKIEGVPTHPDLGGYGDTYEWKQYVISDDNESETGQCPFSHHHR
ncbi:MAG: YqcI/YcgG family protein [Rickettsiaceae bacterium]|nr:YqcI/YcgG family protein [Rickettsiaceae bacterium]